MEQYFTNKTTKYLFISYISSLFFIYFIYSAGRYGMWGFHNTIVRNMHRDLGYAALFNFVPFRNINQFIFNSQSYNFDIIIRNLVYPILIFLPFGFFAKISIPKLSFTKKLLYFLVVTTCIMLLRAFILFGFFDIDKIMLNTLGFSLGYLATKVMLYFYNQTKLVLKNNN
jgi:glycopeptide antibiotics resistance protein